MMTMTKTEFPVFPDGRIDADALREIDRRTRTRHYWHPEAEPGVLFPSVTSIAKLFDNMGGLSRWQRRLIAKKWLDDPKYVQRLVDEGVDAERQIIGIPDRVSRLAGEEGDLLHKLVERSLTDPDFDEADAAGVIGEHYVDEDQLRVGGKFQQAMRALAQLRVIPLACEAVAYSAFDVPQRWAGAVDLVAQADLSSPIFDAFNLDKSRPLTLIIDLKTGESSPYPAAAVQVGGYMMAERIYGTAEPLEFDRSHMIGLVLHARPKSYSWLPVNFELAQKGFEACLRLYDVRKNSLSYLGDPILK